MKPFRINIHTECVVSMAVLKAQAATNAHYPRVQKSAPHGRRLAVVGGGPLVINHIEELRAWDGDIWGINYTAQWLNERGIPAILYSLDPLPMRVKAPRALLATGCHPDVLQQFEGRLEVFDLCETHEDGITGGATSAARAPALSFAMGYLDVSFFGCEGSFAIDATNAAGELLIRDHVDRHEDHAAQMIIRAGGVDYCTTPGFLVQCQQLATLFNTFPDVYHNRSGGLVQAMVEHPDTWEVVGVSPALKTHLEAVNGHNGLYDEPYRPAA